MGSTAKDEEALVAKLDELRPFAQELRESLKCAICLDCIEDAQQLKCGHVFCMGCVQGMLKMKHKKGGPRCAMCKAEVTRRNYRPAPIDYSVLVKSLLGIEETLDAHAPEPKRSASQPTGPIKKINDGFDQKAKVETARRRKINTTPPTANINSNSAPREPLIPTMDIRHTSPTTPSPRQRRRINCSLCPALQGHGDKRPHLGEMRPIAGSKRKVHENCAKFSNDITVSDSNVFHHVAAALNKSSQVNCSYERCGGISATIHCAVEGCERRYHYECAVHDGAQLIDDERKVYCARHYDTDNNNGNNIIVQSKATVDPNERNSNICYICSNVGHLVMCDFCDNSVHLSCANIRRAPDGDFKCPACTAQDTAADAPSNVTQVEDEYQYQCSPGSDSLVSVQELSPARTPTTSTRKTIKRKKSSGATVTARKPPTSKRARRTITATPGDNTSRGLSQAVLSKKFVLSTTGLDETQKSMVAGVAKNKKTTVKSDFQPSVTHMICNAFEPTDAPTRTMKLCKAIACGKQIVCYKWIEDSFGRHGTWKDVDEHVHPLTRKDGNLFQGSSFYFGDLGKMNSSKDDLVAIIKLGNGTVLTEKPRVSSTQLPSKLYLVEDQNTSPVGKGSQRSRKRGGRRTSLVNLVYDIAGDVEIVEPSWILDRCTMRND